MAPALDPLPELRGPGSPKAWELCLFPGGMGTWLGAPNNTTLIHAYIRREFPGPESHTVPSLL